MRAFGSDFRMKDIAFPPSLHLNPIGCSRFTRRTLFIDKGNPEHPLCPSALGAETRMRRE